MCVALVSPERGYAAFRLLRVQIKWYCFPLMYVICILLYKWRYRGFPGDSFRARHTLCLGNESFESCPDAQYSSLMKSTHPEGAHPSQ